MKRIKKLLAVMLAAIMVMSMGTSVFADEDVSYKLTITGVATNSHTFSAWQIFAGSVSSDGETLGDVTWGKGVDYTTSKNEKTIYAALAEISITSGGTTTYPFKSGENALTSAADVAKALADNSSSSEILDNFISAITPYLTSAATAESNNVTGSSGIYSYEIDVTSSGAGYYLVKDTTENLGDDDAYTDFIVQILGSQNVEVKSSVPSVTKTVTDTDGTTQVNATSASAGETVSFTLTATMPSTYATYDTYKLVFHDTLSTNLRYNNDAVVIVYNYTACESLNSFVDNTTYYEVNNDGAYVVTEDTSASSEKTYYTCVSTTVASSEGGYTVSTSDLESENPCSLHITINDTNALKGSSSNSIGVDSTTTIVVTYTATVTDNISSGSSEYNSVKLEYSNDPNTTTSTGTTTEEKVYVYTFDLNVNKVDGDSVALSGASFSLYKKVSVSSWESSTDYYTISGTSATKVDKTTVSDPDSETTYYVLVKDKVEAASSSGSYTATFNDLGEGTYALVESVTPAGYNTADAEIFTISAEFAEGGNSVSALTTNNSKVSAVSGSTSTLTTTVQNVKGSSLPTTGGIGTTIFYVVGAILVLGAGVVLITRRRMAR